MRKSWLGTALLAGVSFACFAGGAQAAPLAGAAVFDEPASNALLEDAAVEVHVYRGNRYCFSFEG